MRKPGLLAAATISMLVLVCGVALAADKQCKANDGRACCVPQQADTLLGTDKFESVYGRGGADTIKSFAGGDTVDCGADDDAVCYDPGDTVRDYEVRRDLQGNPQ